MAAKILVKCTVQQQMRTVQKTSWLELAVLWLVGLLGIAACHESEVQYINLDSGVHTGEVDSSDIIGRDSAHRVDSETGTSMQTDGDSETLSTDTDTTSANDTGTDTDTVDGPDTDGGTDSASDVESDSDSDVRQTWTLLLYMNADSNLEKDMMLDLQEVAAVKPPAWLNILVLFDRHELYDTTDGNWTGTRLFRLKPVTGGLERMADDSFLLLTNDGDNEELDMGDVNTLERFIQLAEASFTADHYGLVMSGHGNGWMKKGAVPSPWEPRVISTDDSGNTEGISVHRELGPMLTKHAIDVLGFDACLMAMVEVAWSVKDSVQYMIASEGNEASYGWDYRSWLTDWAGNSDGSPRSLATEQVNSYARFHKKYNIAPWLMTMSAIDTSKLDALGTALDELVHTYTLVDFVYQAMTFDEFYNSYFDLWDIADLAGDDQLKAMIEDAVIANWNSDETEVPAGLSIMYFDGLLLEYRQTPFCKELDWC